MSVERVLEKVLERDPLSINTDWNGTLLITALLEWEKVTGDSRYGEFAVSWFEAHAEHDHKLSDEEFYRTFNGVRSEVIREGPIPFSAYCGHFGLVYPCAALHAKIKNGPAEAADAIASYIADRAPRSANGCVYHDPETRILIPDTCYYVAPVLAIAAELTGRARYRIEAARQLRAYCELLQDEQTGLAFTLWKDGEIPRRFWTRATGWLGGALVNTLAYLPGEHADYDFFASRLRRLAEGIRSVQRDDGGLHVLLDQPDSPVDSTGPAMAVHWLRSGMVMGILGREYEDVARKAWEATARFILPEGKITNAYTGWAMDAVGDTGGEFDREMDFYKGLVLIAAAAVHGSRPNGALA